MGVISRITYAKLGFRVYQVIIRIALTSWAPYRKRGMMAKASGGCGKFLLDKSRAQGRDSRRKLRRGEVDNAGHNPVFDDDPRGGDKCSQGTFPELSFSSCLHRNVVW